MFVSVFTLFVGHLDRKESATVLEAEYFADNVE